MALWLLDVLLCLQVAWRRLWTLTSGYRMPNHPSANCASRSEGKLLLGSGLVPCSRSLCVCSLFSFSFSPSLPLSLYGAFIYVHTVGKLRIQVRWTASHVFSPPLYLPLSRWYVCRDIDICIDRYRYGAFIYVHTVGKLRIQVRWTTSHVFSPPLYLPLSRWYVCRDIDICIDRYRYWTFRYVHPVGKLHVQVRWTASPPPPPPQPPQPPRSLYLPLSICI